MCGYNVSMKRDICIIQYKHDTNKQQQMWKESDMGEGLTVEHEG